MKQASITKSKTTILVTDSGLGGLSVFADIAKTLKKGCPWDTVSMIYFNAWPEQSRGYNHFPDMEKQARVFTNALSAMARFKPDQILVACNTLSVIYPLTRFSKTTSVDVTGIVDYGVQLIFEYLQTDPDSSVIVFGTPTTAVAQSHEQQLVERGINSNRIITQGCVNLANRIEQNPFDTDVKEMIDSYVQKASLKLKALGGRVFAALCCTHFGYCSDMFRQSINDHITLDTTILNPNIRMAKFATKWPENTKLDVPEIQINIVSQVCLEKECINTYARMLNGISPETVAALGRYQWNQNLFDV